MVPLLKHVQVPPDSIPAFFYVICTTQLGVISKFVEGTFNPPAYVIDKGVEEYQSQHGLFRNTIQ